ncbi:hypothetical protein C8R45DRAFT_833835, partial [Mycena sanguinolenta]
QCQAQKNELMAKLKRKEKISAEDETWLDNAANDIDERRILDKLEAASDLDRALTRLDSNEARIVGNLQALGDDGQPKESDAGPSNKKKSAYATLRLESCCSLLLGPAPKTTENATLVQRIEVLDWYHANGKNQTKSAKHFQPLYPNLRIEQPLVSAWLKEEAKWRRQYQEAIEQGRDGTAKRIRQVEHPEIDEMLELWVAKAMRDKVQLSGQLLRTKWTRFADLAKVPADECLALSYSVVSVLLRFLL